MNYKILAASVLATGAIIAFSMSEATSPPSDGMQLLETVPMMAHSVDYAPSATQSNYTSANSAIIPQNNTTEPAAGEPQPWQNPAAMDGAVSEGIPAAMPQIAYRFGYGFRLPGESIKTLQDRHADQCESKGPFVCRIISMQQSDPENGQPGGSLHLAVASEVARAFGKELSKSADDASGELMSSSIDGEDLSKQIVDTEARLRARTVLRDRLMEVLRSRRGTVAELVEAERGVAQVNEEIDQARSWLTEMRSRVRFSALQIEYQAQTVATKEGFVEDVSASWGVVGAILGSMLTTLIVLLSVGVPLALIGWVLFVIWRRFGRPIAENLRGPEAKTATAEG